MESPDFAKALRMFAESRDAFDVWFKSVWRTLPASI
jgi:hypothetical protein